MQTFAREEMRHLSFALRNLFGASSYAMSKK
jgi:hypothetical protein